MYPIASYTVSGNSTTQFTFSNIPQNFTHLQIRASWNCYNNSSGNSGYMGFNGDSGSNYSWHYILGSGSSASSGNGSSSGSMLFGNYPWYTGTSSPFFATNIIDILDYNNSNKNKTINSLNAYDTNGTIQGCWIFSGCWYNTNSINSITIGSSGSGNYYMPNSRFDLYGITTSNVGSF
jgi:hypothetical protein